MRLRCARGVCGLLLGFAAACAAPGLTEYSEGAGHVDAATAERDAGPPADAGADAPREGVDAAADPGDAGDGATADSGASCVPSLANTGAADFTIRMRVRTRATGRTTLAYQRATCGHGVFWDVHLEAGGVVSADVDDGVDYALLSGKRPVNDGAAHWVELSRRAAVLTLYVDGVADATALSRASLGALPALGTGSGDPCEGSAGQAALVGDLTDVCLARP